MPSLQKICYAKNQMRKILQLALFTCISFGSYAQRAHIDSMLVLLKKTKSADSTMRIFHTLAFDLANVNPDSGIIVGKQAVELCLHYKNDSNYQASANALGWAYYRANKYDSAEMNFSAAIAVCQKLHFKKSEGRARLNMVSVFLAKKNYEKALTYALPVTALFEAEKDEEGKAYAEKQIGIIYRDMGQLEKAKAYLQTAAADFLAMGNTDYYMTTLPSLASLYLTQKKYDSSLFYYRQALAYQEQNLNINTAFARENMGDVFFNMATDSMGQRYNDSALLYYQKARSFFAQSSGADDVAFEEINIGKCLINLKRYTEAIKYLSGSLNTFKTNNEPDYAYQAAIYLASAYEGLGNYKLAYNYLNQSNVYKDSVDANNNKEKIAGMFAQYETDKKDRTILLLNTQKKLAQQEISRQHIITIFIVSVVILGCFLVFILWNRRTIKQKLKEVEMRNQLSSDLHDDIGSSLSSILLLSNMAAQANGDRQLSENLLKIINSNTQEVIDRMSDIVWSMNPRFDEGESLRERIEYYVSGLKEATPATICLNIDPKIDQYQFTMELRKNIFLIIKEAINNALKYSGAGRIHLDFIASDRNFTVTIKDDGKGFDKTIIIPGNGFETMINRAKGSDGTCEIISAPGAGTLVKAAIPIPNIR